MPNQHLDFPGDYNLDKIEIKTATRRISTLEDGYRHGVKHL